MKFEVHGGFEIWRKPNRHGIFNGLFWQKVSEDDEDLPSACGCYVFALKNGNNIVPWYVGKTERRTFKAECFQATKINYFNDILIEHNGTPLLFLLPRCTASGQNFSRPTRGRYRDIDFLESMLIGYALERNSGLVNIHKTKLLREMVVPGVMNSPPGFPGASQQELRSALGLEQ